MLEINKIHQGDCLELMKQIDDESVDMILCDLPYGKTRNKWDSQIDLKTLWFEWERIIKQKGVIILTADQPFTSALVFSNLKLFRYSMVWHKTTPTGHLNAKRMPLKSHEDILVFYKSLPYYNPQKTKGHIRKVSSAHHKRNSKKTTNYGSHGLTSYDSTERYPTSVLTFSTDKQKEALHPTQKPLALFEYLIKSYSKKGDLVLDNCIGSGTTAIVCRMNNRNFIGIELEQEYVNLCNKRLSKVVE